MTDGIEAGVTETGLVAPLSLKLLELTDWLWCLRTPVAACWAVRDGDGIVMVDANVAAQDEAIVNALADRLGSSADTVRLRQVLLTHAHADHYGSARELARRTGAELLGPAEE
ncbi:MAG TPA: MBL fold metallo-hydrolase, partial [Galbitalea sp.]|nr:MBL fold metallo-hydrolase [Galbitalea sp.]